ncbi:hypothetical protein CA603_18155 [Paraburkholderia hospita]|nr:hypothetical protein CA603_18155 [Paraburkholderia hospita]
MPRFYVTHDGPFDVAPLTRSGTYRLWDELKIEPIREVHWFELRGAPLVDADRTLSQREACAQTYALERELNSQGESANAYRRRK